MPADSATSPYAFTTDPLPLEAAFNGGRLTSDGGLPWLVEADGDPGLTAALAACLPEWRARAGWHPPPRLVRQRVYQSACGYVNQDDADAVRRALAAAEVVLSRPQHTLSSPDPEYRVKKRRLSRPATS